MWKLSLLLCASVAWPRAVALRLVPRMSSKPAMGLEPQSRSQRILQGLEVTEQGSAAGASGSWEGLQRLEGMWQAMKSGTMKAPTDFVRDFSGGGIDEAVGLADFPTDSDGQITTDFDVVVCGGALGIFLAASLQRRGLRVAVVERGLVKGREQEWNISLDEIEDLVEAGALTPEDVTGALENPGPRKVNRSKNSDDLVAAHFGSVRAGFNNEQQAADADERQEIWIPEVLNLGVRPSVAVSKAKKNFESSGGTLYEKVNVQNVDVFTVGNRLSATTEAGEDLKLTTRLVVDAMGNASPIARQIRGDKKPFGICAVVGTCASGFDLDNNYADLIYTNMDIWNKEVDSRDELGSPRKQYFWEAFPAGSSEEERTTYLFTYMDAEPDRPSLLQMMEDYWDLLPEYQRESCSAFRDGLSAEQAIEEGRFNIKRVLFGCFPTYKDSPLNPPARGIIAIGDASGIQSPLSFGGFGALTRHIDRYTSGICDALEANALSQKDLAKMNPYLPNLSATWMFQRSMMVPLGSRRPPDFVNRLLRTNFEIMDDLGPRILRPFNQDVVRPGGLLKVLSIAFLRDLPNIPILLFYLGPLVLLDWMGHMGAMVGTFALYKSLGSPLLSVADKLWEKGGEKDKVRAYGLRRQVEGWKYGCGEDYFS